MSRRSRDGRYDQKEGGEATFVQVDVSKQESVEALVDKAIELYGRIDVMHNNAGIGGLDRFSSKIWISTIAPST